MTVELQRKTRIAAWLFLVPGLVVYLVFVVGPLIVSFYYSLIKWNGVGPQLFVGLENFQRLLSSDQYGTAFWNTIELTVVSLIVQIPTALVLAFLLYRSVHGTKVFRALIFLPVVISPIAIGFMFTIFYNSELGPLNVFLDAVGLSALKTQWLSNPDVLLYAVMAPQVWQFIGLHMVILFAALQTVPEELFESAHIDGASSMQVFFRLVVPLLWEVIQITVVLCVTGSLKSFGHPWIMTQGGPGVQSSYLTVLMFRVAFLERNFGSASAITATVVLLALAFTVVFRRLTRRDKTEY
jgi:raffinose/stachyose/melibiose transport system permease protein